MYEIKDINKLESSIQELINANLKLSNETTALESLLKELRTTWQNNNANDIQSVITELNVCITKLRDTISPSLEKYSNTMNTLVQESRTNQNKSV